MSSELTALPSAHSQRSGNRRGRIISWRLTGTFPMTNIDETTVLSLAPNASFQAMGEGAVILMLDSGQLYTCNETTEAFLKLIDGKRDFGAIISLLLGEFDTDRETLSGDLLPIAGELRSAGVVVIRSGE
jgi:hypothetical protein